MNHLITIVSVNWNANDFTKLLLESIELFCHTCTTIIVDNSSNPTSLSYFNTKQIITNENIGHGAALNLGAKDVATPFTMFVDIDCHFIRKGWETELLELCQPIVGGKGVSAKPIRPACMLMTTEIAQKYNWEATPGYQGHRLTPSGYDVAIKAYHQMIKEKININLIESVPNHYGTLNGEEWTVNQKPFLYHHWHGTSLNLECRKADFPGKDLLKDKSFLFSQIPWRLL